MRFTKAINIQRIITFICFVFALVLAIQLITNPKIGIYFISIPIFLIFFIKPFIALAIFVFLIPFETSLMYIGVDEFTSFMKIYGVLLLFIFLLYNLIKRGFSFSAIPNIKLILVFLALMLLSALFPTDREQSLIQYLTYLQLFILYIIIVNFVDNEEKFRYLFVTLLFAGSINAAFSIYNYYFSSGTVFAGGTDRASGFLLNANRFGYMQGIISLSTFFFLLNNKSKYFRLLTIPIPAIIMFSSFLSLSRGIFIAFLISMLYALNYFFRQGQKKIFLGVLILFIVSIVFIPQDFWNRMETIIHPDVSEGSSSTRRAFILDGFRMGIAHPFMGVGLGRFKEEFLNFSNAVVSPTAGTAHNMYISLMAENGIPVLIVFLLLVYKILAQTIKTRNSADKRLTHYAFGIEIALVFTLAAGFFGALEYSKIFWLFLALAATVGKINEAIKNKGVIHH